MALPFALLRISADRFFLVCVISKMEFVFNNLEFIVLPLLCSFIILYI